MIINYFPILEKIKPESVLKVIGKVLRRGLEQKTLELETGKIEISIQAARNFISNQRVTNTSIW